MVSTAFWLLLLGFVSCTSTTSTVEPRTKVDHFAPQEPFLDQCTPVPTWTIGGERAVNLVGKNITVVALLNSSRLFGRKQAARLSSLRSRLYQAGFPDINFFVINSILATDNTNLLQNEAVDIPVYQEHPEAPVRDILGAENDHILVLDRCGRLAYQVITPFSKLIYPYVKAAILSTYKDNPCGFCISSRVDMGIEEHNIKTSYASDEPVHDGCMFCNTHTSLATNSETNPQATIPGKVHGEENQSHRSVSIQPQRNYLSTTKNQLNQLFQDLGATLLPESKNNSKSAAQQTVFRNAEDLQYTFNMTSSTLPKRYDQRPSRPIIVSTIPEEQELTRNWNWFERQKSVERMQSSGESNETESVEVVGRVRPLKIGKTKKKKSKRKEYRSDYHLVQEPLENHIADCKKHQKCHSNSLTHEIILDSHKVVHDSMEALVNQTQQLFDWYQHQIENGTSSEEEYEKSNILKEKIIEHYSRLLPWLNFKLTPETHI